MLGLSVYRIHGRSHRSGKVGCSRPMERQKTNAVDGGVYILSTFSSLHISK